MDASLYGGSREQFARSFFGCIIIMLIPVIVKSTLLPAVNFTALMASAFVLQVLWCLTLVIAGHAITISVVSVLFLLNACLGMVINALSGRGINSYDLINISVKIGSLILFVDTVTRKTVSREKLSKYAKCMMLLSIIACIYNLGINSYGIVKALTTNGSAYAVNIKSFFLNRNQFGMFLVVSYVVTDYAYVGKRSRTKSLVHIFQAANIVLTLSRGSVLAVVAYSIARQLFFIENRKKLWRFITMSICAGILTIMVIQTPQLNSFVTNKLLRIDAGDTGRTDVWLMGLQVFLNNPIHGVGTYTGLNIAIAQGFKYEQFHNFFIDILVSGGIIELSITLFILTKIYKRCMRNLKGTEYIAIYQSSMIALLCMGCIESVSFFSMGYVDTLFTINFVTLPLLMANMTKTNRNSHILHESYSVL